MSRDDLFLVADAPLSVPTGGGDMPSDVMAALGTNERGVVQGLFDQASRGLGDLPRGSQVRDAFFEIQRASARSLARTEPSLQHEPPALRLVPAPAREGSR